MHKPFQAYLSSNSLLVLIGLLLRLINIQMPILGVHSWRQADTSAMARHFALEKTQKNAQNLHKSEKLKMGGDSVL